MANEVTIATIGAPVVEVGRHAGHGDHPDPGSVFLGMTIGAGLVLLAQRRTRRKARIAELFAAENRAALAGDREKDGRFESDFAALARRTATLERIVTDPAHRVDREIEALR